MNFMALELRPLYAVLISLTASGLIYVLGEHIRPNAREGITLTAAVLKIITVYSMIPAVLAGKEIRLGRSCWDGFRMCSFHIMDTDINIFDRIYAGTRREKSDRLLCGVRNVPVRYDRIVLRG